jgi:hypothetical protein
VISKSLRGNRLGGLVRYLFGPGRFDEHTNQRIVAASDPTWRGAAQPHAAVLEQLIAELDAPTTQHGDSTRAGYVYHLVVSVPQGDGQLSDAAWQQAAQRFADKLGFDEQVNWIAVNHGASTNGNDHIHFVANLIRADDGTAHKLSFDRLRQREACIELEEELGLTATSPAGMGEGRDLSRREVEQLRSGAIGSVSDLGQHRVATIVRAVAAGARSEGEFVERLRGEGLIVKARYAKQDRGTVTGYSVAAKTGGREPLVWYGGGRLGKDLRLPALRTKWGQTDEQRKSSAAAWFSDAERRRKAEPANLAGAADAMRQAAARLQKVPPEDRFSWYVAAAESAGVVAAAANTTTDDRARRELIKAWQAINRATPAATTVGVDVAPGDAAQLRAVVSPEQAGEQVGRAVDEQTAGQVDQVRQGVELQRPAAVFAAPVTGQRVATDAAGELSTLLGGTSRVLMAARLADAPQHAAVQALLVQAVELAAQIARTLAAQREASAAQQRAAAATERALSVLTSPARPAGWQFTRSGAEVLEAARQARAAGAELDVDQPRSATPEQGVEPPEPGR